MDVKIFWLVSFILIAVSGSVLIFARRYKNKDEDAGKGIASWTIVFLLLWLLAALDIIH